MESIRTMEGGVRMQRHVAMAIGVLCLTLYTVPARSAQVDPKVLR